MPEKKKKLIRVEGLGSSNPYAISSMNFSFVSSPADGRRQVCGIMTCRENVNSAVWSALNEQTTSYYNVENPDMDFTKLRLLMVHDADRVDDFKRRLFNGKAALNLLEGLAGWKKSTITTVKHSNYKNAWLLTGPEEWMSQPQLLSLATWVLRLAGFKGPLNVDSYDHLEKSFFDIQQKDNGNSDSRTYCKEFWNKAFVLVKYHKEIFTGMSLKDSWPKSATSGFGVYSGLLTFCQDSASYSNQVRAAQKRFTELCGKYLPRKNKLLKGGK